MGDAFGSGKANFMGWHAEIEASKRLPLQRPNRADAKIASTRMNARQGLVIAKTNAVA
ncbi:hypothetical protein [Burkholderia ambifaria]|uniref:hypothetical protein n=1 Tax=Burkholderia ambifaria TaxID=152480 RepID=UPI00158EBDD0|nr:hypothetical protein [Burkholderia ambifaria]